MTNEDFVKLALQKADYSEEEIEQVLKMKKAQNEEPPKIPEKDPAPQDAEKKTEPEASKDPAPQDAEKKTEPEASKDNSGELDALRKQLDEVRKQLKTAQEENTRKSETEQKPDDKKKIEDIIRSFM